QGDGALEAARAADAGAEAVGTARHRWHSDAWTGWDVAASDGGDRITGHGDTFVTHGSAAGAAALSSKGLQQQQQRPVHGSSEQAGASSSVPAGNDTASPFAKEAALGSGFWRGDRSDGGGRAGVGGGLADSPPTRAPSMLARPGSSQQLAPDETDAPAGAAAAAPLRDLVAAGATEADRTRTGKGGTCSSALQGGPAAAASPSAARSEPGLRHAARLVLGNALMWTTGAATVVSMLGLHTLLDPAVPSHVPALGFIEGTLSWLARCAVPVSLFAMGLFTASRPVGAAPARSIAVYLAIRMLLLPWLMVFVNSLLGLGGQLGRSLVLLTCVPVGQNAFLVTEQYGEGAEVVTSVMQLGLLLMLPHVAAVLTILHWFGLYEETSM
ncbi:hypothetical protein Agub_g5934, partial [Astrephomene gubernaculifera]